MENADKEKKYLIMTHACFKLEAINVLCWETFQNWNFLEEQLKSRVFLWNQECSILPILCYANANISNDVISKSLKQIPSHLMEDKFFGKNAMQHAIDHNNWDSVETLRSMAGFSQYSLEDIQGYARMSASEYAEQLEFGELFKT